MATNDQLNKMPDVGTPAPVKSAGKWLIWFVIILAIVCVLCFIF